MVATWAPGDLIYTKTYGEWTAAFWTWLTGFQQASANSASCDLSQTDPNVFFLAGFLEKDGGPGDPGGINRTCISISNSKAILAAPINKLSTLIENPGLASIGQLRDKANLAINQVTSQLAVIDGTAVDLQRVYYNFMLELPTGPNFFGPNAVNTDAASDGYWLFIKKTDEGGLSIGSHTLQIIGTGIDHTANPKPFTSSVTYTLNIA